MCRNIKTLYNFEPPATADEVRAAAVQFVRKVSGFQKPSQSNEGPVACAIEEIADSVDRLLSALVTNAPAKDREDEAAKARRRAVQRFGTPA